MAVNLDKPTRWKADIARSVDFYNDWFLNFAPETFRSTRIKTTEQVIQALQWTGNLRQIQPDDLIQHPQVLPMLRMSTCPPIARDRLIGLADVPKNLVESMEQKNRIPPRMKAADVQANLMKLGNIIRRLADPDIFVWLNREEAETDVEVSRAATIVADRLCGTVADPIIRNAQEQRQLRTIKLWLENRGYRAIEQGEISTFRDMPSGTFSFRLNVPGYLEDGKEVKIPIDAVIKPLDSGLGDMPIFIEAKSAGDFTNTNKRRKEEASKIMNLRRAYGEENVIFNLFLCGYFDCGYLGYEAGEGIDWVWEHRVDDLVSFGI